MVYGPRLDKSCVMLYSFSAMLIFLIWLLVMSRNAPLQCPTISLLFGLNSSAPRVMAMKSSQNLKVLRPDGGTSQ